MLKNVILLVVKYISSLKFVNREASSANARKIINLYAKKGFVKEFVKLRFWFGPVNEINDLVPMKGRILEIGCGEGIVSNFLGLSSKKRKVIGMELVSERVSMANVEIKNVDFKQGNILTSVFPQSEVIVISHVLHHLLSLKDQEKALKKCFDALPINGKLIIAEVNRNLSVKYLFGWFIDVVVVPIFFEHQLVNFNVYHRNFVDWIGLLNKNGFSVSHMQFTTKRPYPEVIFVATKINT